MITIDISALLLLDDDQDMLDIIDMKLKSLFFINYKLYDNEDSFLEELGDGVHIIVLDHTLVKRNGLAVINIIKGKNPENFVIGFSGLDNTDILIDYINSDIDRWVNKNKPNYDERLVSCIMQGVEHAKEVAEYQRRELEFKTYFEEKKLKYDQGTS